MAGTALGVPCQLAGGGHRPLTPTTVKTLTDHMNETRARERARSARGDGAGEVTINALAQQLCNDTVFKTTYKQDYRHARGLPPIKYSQQPAIQLCAEGVPALQPRMFPLIPGGPRRRLCREPPLAAGLGTSDLPIDMYTEPKPIVRTYPTRLVNQTPSPWMKRVQGKVTASQTNVGSSSITTADSLKTSAQHMPSSCGEQIVKLSPAKDFLCPNLKESQLPEIVNAIYHDVTWTSTTRKATEEGKMPASQRNKVPCGPWLYETRADMVAYRPTKYEPQPENWQQVAAAWDRAQTRPHPQRSDVDINPAKLIPSRLQYRRIKRMDTEIVKEEIMRLGATCSLSTPFVRQCPGYAGFLPRQPIEAPLEQKTSDPGMNTVMKASYGSFPTKEYNIQQHAHRGPMSHTVTLTYPYNPFNKVEKRTD